MAALAIQVPTESGLSLTLSTASGGGDVFSNTGNEMLVIRNADATSKTVTVNTQVTSFDSNRFGKSVKENQVITVAAGATAVMGTFARNSFNNASGQVEVTYSAVTSLTVAVIRV